jgi:cytochrome P450
LQWEAEAFVTTMLAPRTEPGLYPPTVEPASAPLPLPRFLVRFVRNPLATVPRASYEEGIVVGGAGLWLTDPALIETVLLHEAERFAKAPLEKQVLGRTLGDGLLTSQGTTWRWQRRTAAPLFRPAELTGLVPVMSRAAEAQLERWRACPAGMRQPVDRAMTETTFHVISESMFAGSADAEAAAILRAAEQVLVSVSWDIAAAMLRFPAWLWYPGKYSRRRAGVALRAAVAAILARRQAAGLEGDDLLVRLARARDPETGAPMSERQLIDNLLTFLAAGHETTAKALTWALYLVARAPEWQQRVRREVQAVAGDTAIDAGHLEHLVVTRAVIEETMRLYPPAPIMARQATSAGALGGVAVPEGALVMIPIYALHRHRRLWEDPDRFDPERFFPERRSRIARTQFMPFGFGQRTCIGASFAMMEGVAILATLVRGAEFQWDGRHLPEPLSRITPRPKGGMPLGVSVVG